MDKIPKLLRLTILFLGSLDIPISVRVGQLLLYLWREFYIKVSIEPVITDYKVVIYYKNKYLSKTKIKDLKELCKMLEELKYLDKRDKI